MMNFDDVRDLALRISKDKFLRTDDVYVDLLLTLMLPDVQKKFDFILKGGTAVLKTYLTPYRFSYDLDFSYFSSGHPRKQYKKYKKDLEMLFTGLGFKIANPEKDKYREGGRIFILKLMDKPKYLKIPIKISISSIDKQPCYKPVKKKFNLITDIPKEPYDLLYPNITNRIRVANAKVLTIEELCAEKVRALSTRGPKGEWSLILRDLVDLYAMDRKGILNGVLKNKSCLRKKLFSVKGTSYWDKFKSFMSTKTEVVITKEDRAIFIDQRLLKEKELSKTLNKIKNSLKWAL